jgi:hypothetical protein
VAINNGIESTPEIPYIEQEAIRFRELMVKDPRVDSSGGLRLREQMADLDELAQINTPDTKRILISGSIAQFRVITK